MRKAIVLLETLFSWKIFKKSGIRFWSNNRLDCDLFSELLIFGPTGVMYYLDRRIFAFEIRVQVSHDTSDGPSIG